MVARVLSGYNFNDAAAAARFLDPRLKDVSDPFLLPQMEAAVRRIWRAIAQREKILVYGDYDVDGIVSAALLLKVLCRLGANDVRACLPDRREEGYGLSVAALRRALEQAPPGLVITVDCGIAALEAAAFLKSRAIDLVVTDHHEPRAGRPEAVAIVNPQSAGDERLKMLAGVGVAFKLAHALVKHGRPPAALSVVDLKEYLDLVALGTVADVVPLLEENRIFVKHGLPRINNGAGPAWRALQEAAGLKGKLDVYHLAFNLAPRLNAAGRLATAETALQLLMTDDEKRARLIAQELDQANRARQAIEKQILNEAIAEIDGYFDPKIHYGLVVGRRAWHVGVIGIVASRLAARYNRPAIVIGFDEHGAGRGSGRSIEGYNILRGLNAGAAGLAGWGGHEMAAGLELDEKNIGEFRTLFNRAVEQELRGRNLARVQPVNAWIQLADISEESFQAVERLAPFGQSNPRPVFAARGVKIVAPPRVLAGKHLRFNVAAGQTAAEAVAFNAAERKAPEGLIDLAFQIRKNVFNGSAKLELNVLDFRPTTAAEAGV